MKARYFHYIDNSLSLPFELVFCCDRNSISKMYFKNKENAWQQNGKIGTQNWIQYLGTEPKNLKFVREIPLEEMVFEIL